ncbi:hypothetical protein [Streptomyces sp. NPDC046925]|uniref:hypothetical protein n=1 Tax=Streptomyces sp. NPDC046925 TaxID=3155375 RepID=UPI0033CB5CA8
MLELPDDLPVAVHWERTVYRDEEEHLTLIPCQTHCGEPVGLILEDAEAEALARR